MGLTSKFITYRTTRDKEWKKLYSNGIMGDRPKLQEAINAIALFVLPLLQAAAENKSFNYQWQKDKSWQAIEENES